MNNNEIKEALALLSTTSYELENEYCENGGEVTEATEAKEAEIAAIKELLEGEGIDSLGRWLKAKEDEKKALKAEKDYITRRMAACDSTIDYIKYGIGQVLRVTGQEKVKGLNGYSFSQYDSIKTSTNKDNLKALYEQKINDLLVANHIPCYIGVSLTASSTKFAEYGPLAEGDESIFETTREATCKFTKPRASKEE